MRSFALSAALAAVTFLAACSGSIPGDQEVSRDAAPPAKWATYERPESYPGMTTITGLRIPMRDGVTLSASVALPADAGGTAVAGRFPVILTQTGYNKSLAAVVPAFPTFNEFLVRRGYAHVAVDVRGTGHSGGNWEAFGQEEQDDYAEVMEWVAMQEWSDGRVGTWGPSFMGITQIFTAAYQHPAHKAVFAIVPEADAYRDIVFAGGQVNAGFIPLWMGLVTALSVIPAEPDANTPGEIAAHAINAITNFQVPTIVQSAIGAELSYDGPFWRTRSPIEVADRIRIPTFVIGGLNDLFQRGEPMLYERIKDNADARLLIGPWQHLDGSTGAGLPVDAVPDFDHLALMWFDQHVMGLPSGASAVPRVTQWYWGEERYVTATDWPHPQARAQRWFLRSGGALTAEAPAAGEASTLALQQPVNGICSTSTSQWTAGILGMLPLPCFTDNRLNEALLEKTFTTAPMDRDYAINGPIQADLFVSSTALDASVLVRVTDVSPDGTSRELTNGILTGSMGALDPVRSRWLDGQMIQPWHPFTQESKRAPGFNEVMALAVEVFPTSAVIKAGHSLRISISASDFPHGLPPLVDLASMPAGILTIHSDAERPSSVVLPVVPMAAVAAGLP